MTLGRRIDKSGNTYVGGTTWHVAVAYNDENRVRPCFEVEWDDHGVGTLTGNRADMTESECERTQVVAWIDNHLTGVRSERVDGAWVESPLDAAPVETAAPW